MLRVDLKTRERYTKKEKEIVGMNNEEKILTMLERLDGRIDKLEDDMNLEFYAVREEMNMVYKLLKKEIAIQNNKVDRLIFTKEK